MPSMKSGSWLGGHTLDPTAHNPMLQRHDAAFTSESQRPPAKQPRRVGKVVLLVAYMPLQRKDQEAWPNRDEPEPAAKRLFAYWTANRNRSEE